VPLYMAGARMTANFPTSIVVHGMALNITVQSYDQQMDFGLMADGAAMPDVRTLADALRVAFDDLCVLDDELNAPPTLADTGRAVAAQAGKRVQGSLSSMGGKVGSLVGGMVGSVVKRAVQGAVSGAVKQAAKPAAKPAPAARKAPAKAAGKRPRTIKA
jgi:diacylglycerol O-acyltransferase